MIFSQQQHKIRMVTPINEKINPPKLMHLVKIFSSICNTRFTCQILTSTSKNTWTFIYQANHTIYISISFMDKSNEDYPQIIIENFLFPMSYEKTPLMNKVLKTIITQIQNFDFEYITFQIKNERDIDLCKNIGFKQKNIHQMVMSLKSKFIKR